jgi:putative transposase
VVEDAANVNDHLLLRATIEAVVVERPSPRSKPKQNLSLDKGYDNPVGHQTTREKGYRPHIRPIGEPWPFWGKRRHRPRRWVVERALAWLSKCRAILVRYEKKSQNDPGLLQFACALLWYRRRASCPSRHDF